MASLDRIADSFGSALSRSLERARRIGEGTSRRDQLLAALLLPFFIVAAMAVAVVAKDVLIGMVPEGIPSLAAITFLLGFGLALGTFGAIFAWVKTGGFGLFE